MEYMEKTCTFECGSYEVVYKCSQDVVRHQLSHITQIFYKAQPEWHLDLWNMKCESWDDADNLIQQMNCLVNVIKAGEV